MVYVEKDISNILHSTAYLPGTTVMMRGLVAVGAESLDLVSIFDTGLLVVAIILSVIISIIPTGIVILVDVTLIINRGTREPSLLQLG